MADADARHALFDAFAEVAKALGSGRRAEVIDLLSQGERHVDDIADEIGQSVANTSFHLRSLAAAGLVATRREGTRVYYRLASERIIDLWAALRDVATAHHEDLDDLARGYLGDRDGLEQIGRDELVRRLDAGDVIVVDVRPHAEFGAGHIVGARSVPFDELTRRIRELPTDRDIVVYCRGHFCVFGDDAVRLLRRRGRRARRLEDGFPEWRRDGHPTSEPAA
jgi:DNA-binding transcriptional ArsR family regulator